MEKSKIIDTLETYLEARGARPWLSERAAGARVLVQHIDYVVRNDTSPTYL